MGEDLSDYQSELVADGRVTDAELRDAYVDYRGCMTAEGWEAREPQELASGLYSVTVSGPSDDVSARAMQAQDEKCRAEYLVPLENIYLVWSAPDGDDRSALWESFLACVAKYDIELDGVVSSSDDDSAVTVAISDQIGTPDTWPSGVWDCREKHIRLWPELFGSEE